MDQELAAASTFLAGYLPPSTTDFTIKLTEQLQERYSNHWHPQDPERGSAYRALVRSASASLDQSIVRAAQQSGLSRQEIERALQSADGRVWLGDRWTLWVDPGCVSLRVERGESVGRDSTQFIEIWGKLPESLRSHAVPLASIASASVNISPAAAVVDATSSSISCGSTGGQDANLLSPTKRSSKAIQILPPPSRAVSSSFGTPSTISSPAASRVAAPAALLASPLIIPPTPHRPVNSDAADVFSPTPSPSSAGSLNLGRSPSPLSASAKSYGGLAPSPSGFPLFPSTRRSASRGSFSSSHSQRSSSNASSDSSDGEGSASDGVFSSTESLSSSVTSAGTTSKLWSGAQQSTQEALLDAEFKYPSLPVRPTSAGGNPPLSPYSFPHHRLNVPMSPSKHLSPSSAVNSGARSLPSSPTKPRRRGTRGGSGQGSQSYALAHGHPLPLPASPGTAGAHEAGSSISSMSSITSAASTSRTREQALAGTLTEHSGGKVGVLGGGVLLGLAGAKMLGSARGEVVGEAKRRGRERRRGGGQRKEGGAGGLAPYGMQPQPILYQGGQWAGEMMM